MDPLLRQVMHEYCRGSGAPADWVALAAPRVRREARIHRVRSAAFPCAVAVKIFLDRAQPLQHARRLHAALASYHEPAGRLRVAAPLALLETPPAVVMEWVGGSDLQRVLHGAAPERLPRAEALALSARWLAWFHSRGAVALQPLDVDAALARIGSRAATLPAAARAQGYDDCLASLARHLDTLRGVPLAHGAVHGDFTPYNLLLGGGQVYGIDFLARRASPLVADVNRMLVYLFAHRFAPVSARLLGPRGCARDDWAAFGAHYDARLLPNDEHAFLLLQFLEVMRRWGVLLGEHRPPSRLLRAIEKRRLRAQALHIARLLD